MGVCLLARLQEYSIDLHQSFSVGGSCFNIELIPLCQLVTNSSDTGFLKGLLWSVGP